MTGYEATVQVGIVKTMGRAPSEGLGVPERHDPVPTREEGLRERGLVYCHLKGKHRDQVRCVKCRKGTHLLGMLIIKSRAFATYVAHVCNNGQ